MTRNSPGYWTEKTIISELKIVIDELDHFPSHTELDKMSKGGLGRAIDKHGGSNYFSEKIGYNLLHKPGGYWTEENTTSELKTVIDDLGHFPSHTELDKMSKSGLGRAISINGGFNYFRDKMGYNLSHKPGGYWTEENTISELKTVIDELGHFPSIDDLNKMGKNSLGAAISINGGYNYFRDKMGHDIIKKSKGYWTEENTVSELKLVIDDLGHFPGQNELKEMGKSGIANAISINGGFNYFRDKIGYEILRQSPGYWTEENTMSELKSVIDELGHFPTHGELKELGKNDLSRAISRNSGSNYFSEKMGYELPQKPDGYWTEETIISEMKTVIEELGHFPSPFYAKLNEMGKSDLGGAINKHGGVNHFRDKFGYKSLRKSPSYWTEVTIISELEPIIDEIGRFPFRVELNEMDKSDLEGAINKYGGINHFREKMGFSPSIQEEYISELASYVNKRGQKTEQFVKDIITEWTEIHNEPKPNCNVKLSQGNVLEFVCDLDKTIGIDVTNTKSSKNGTYEQIKRKWRHKDYCLHLDELWIVVFTNVLTSYDYEKLNRKSPDNVKVFSIEGFLKELDYSAENYGKLDRLKECSFHNKEEIINLNRTLDEDY